MRWFDLYVEIDPLSDILLDARIKVGHYAHSTLFNHD